MNIVDVIKSQLTGDVLGKLSSLVGENEDKTKTAVTAAVPGMLSILANLASTSSGADKVINALKQVDTGTQGGFGDILAGPKAHEVQEKGGSLLNILLGASSLPLILSVLSKFAGIAVGPAKGLLSMLAPLILSTIAKQFSGRALTSQALSSFFAEQKGNISSALPAGLSFADIPGLTGSTTTHSTPTHSTATTRPVTTPVREESSGLPSWLLPLVGLGLLGALAWWFLGGQPAVEEKPPVVAPVVKREPAPRIEPKVEPVVAPKVVDTPKIDLSLPDVTKFGTDLTGAYTTLTEVLGGVKDAATADAALPKLTDWTAKLDGFKTVYDKLNDTGKASVAKVTTDHLSKLKDLVGNVVKIGGVSDKFKDIVNAIIAKLAGLALS